MPAEILVLGPGDEALLLGAATDVFDYPPREELVVEFLADPRHHVVVARDHDQVVGFVSAVHFVHPDKPPELWINEISVAPPHRKLRLGFRMLEAMLEVGRGLGCTGAWVLTDRDNAAAQRLYASADGIANDGAVMFEFSLMGPVESHTRDAT